MKASSDTIGCYTRATFNSRKVICWTLEGNNGFLQELSVLFQQYLDGGPSWLLPRGKKSIAFADDRRFSTIEKNSIRLKNITD